MKDDVIKKWIIITYDNKNNHEFNFDKKKKLTNFLIYISMIMKFGTKCLTNMYINKYKNNTLMIECDMWWDIITGTFDKKKYEKYFFEGYKQCYEKNIKYR